MEKIRLLDHSAGTFTFEEQLALIHSDSSSAIVTGEGSVPHSLLRHHVDYDIEFVRIF
jgi:hypothetical protein